MKNFVIITDSCSDLSKAFRQENHIDYAKMMINWTYEDESHEDIADLDWEVLSSEEFYDLIRKGVRFYTSQTTTQNYLETFEPHLKKGEDIIYIACSSGLSASLNVARMLADGELKEKYPNNRLVVIDSLRAGMSLGMMVMDAVNMQKAGKSFDEIVSIIEETKTEYKEIGIPESLTYLKRAGRVSGAAAIMGNLISLKPILVFDENGCNGVLEKAIGKKKAFNRMAEYIKDDIVDPENQEIYLMSADCDEQDINDFKEAVLKQVNVKNIIVQPLGPIIGASSGPGTIIVNYRGKK